MGSNPIIACPKIEFFAPRMFFTLVGTLFGIFFFLSLRFTLSYLGPGLLHYNYAYDFTKLFPFQDYNQRSTIIAPAKYSFFSPLQQSILVPYVFDKTLASLPIISDTATFLNTPFKMHSTIHTHECGFQLLYYYTFSSTVNLSNFLLPTPPHNVFFNYPFCNRVFFFVNSKIFLKSF